MNQLGSARRQREQTRRVVGGGRVQFGPPRGLAWARESCEHPHITDQPDELTDSFHRKRLRPVDSLAPLQLPPLPALRSNLCPRGDVGSVLQTLPPIPGRNLGGPDHQHLPRQPRWADEERPLGLDGTLKMSWKNPDALMKQIAHYANFVSPPSSALAVQRG